MGMRFLLLFTAVPSILGIFESFYSYNNFNNNCTLNEFVCRNGRCISMQKRCDSKNDCLDSSDEEDCDMYLCREPKYFRCKNSRCINKIFYCNGDNDCEDYSDEESCEDFKSLLNKNITCGKNEWQCSNKLCISKDWVCNGELDCLDGSDESLGCSANIECDGFKCKNGHCIASEWKCDGHDDCTDNSDEINCELNSKDCTWDNQQFLCKDNKTCIKLNEVCNDIPQCPDKSDESSLCKALNMSCNNYRCTHECVQLPTGPRCICPKGYHNIDEKHCRDINECEIYGICDQKCQNLPGSYKCTCDMGYILQENKQTCRAAGGDTMMVFSLKNEIRAYFIRSQLYFPVAKHLKQVVGVFIYDNYIYWTDIFAEHESISRSLADGTKRELLITSGLGSPEDLSVDWVTGNIYFTDADRQHIGVCTNNGSYCTVLINQDIHKPRGIALNPDEGEMYWSDWGTIPEIARSLMDGSNDVSFVSSEIHWPNGLTIDYSNERLYWTDAKLKTLESIRLDGTDRRVVLENVIKHPYAIAVFENRLYWSDWESHSIQSCDKFTGKNHHTIIKEQKDYIYGISIYHPGLKRYSNNPCTEAKCSDICLLSGKSYTCACPQNKELNSDRKTCRDVLKKQMLIIGANNMLIHVEHQTLGKHDVTALPIIVKNVGALAYNSINNTLYVSDLDWHKIITLNLHTGASQPLQLSELGKIVAMDYDYLGNNLYVCDAEKRIVEVINLNTMSQKILLHDLNNEIPQSIVLVPTEGIMFIAFQKPHSRESHLDHFLMDGSGRTHPLEHGFLGPISLLYDDDLRRIFIANSETGNIESTSIAGNDRHEFRSLQTYPIGLASLKNDLFWVNEHSKRIYWADKFNSEKSYNKKITLDIPFEVERMHIISVTPKKVTFSPCQINNGNCSHLCLISKKIIKCACPSGMMLDNSNNRTCSKRVQCDDSEFFCLKSNICIKKELYCNGNKDCEFGEDEEHCQPQNQCGSDYFRCETGECISEELLCDLKYDCTDKSDERNCSHIISVKKSCPLNHFKCNNDKCIDRVFVCDGMQDCEDGEDERNCVSATCNELQFRCLSGSCIPKSWECDHEYDCTDSSDEHPQCVRCPSRMFTCGNGKCIDKSFVCNRENECGDNTDEEFCTESSTNCQLNEFACISNKTICVPENARCNGTSECPHHEDEQGCTDCHIDEFTCKNHMCIPTLWICDRVDDCGDNSDEDPSLCSHSGNYSSNHIQQHCQDGFLCKSGHCIDLTDVCNNVHNCFDGSDEGGSCNVSCDIYNNPCSHNCIRTPSGPMCTCNPGHKLLGDGRQCEDINECLTDPPVCSQLCINYKSSFTCDCYLGFILRPDKKSCKAEGDAMSLIFISENQIRELSQKENSLQLLFDEEVPKITGLDVAVRSDFVYFSIENSGTIHRINKKTKTREYISEVGQPQKLVVDWITDNIYFINNELKSKSLAVCNFHDKTCCKLIDIDVHRQVSAIAVDAVNKLLFYSLTSWWLFNSPSYTLYKSNLDGSGITELVKSTVGYVTGISYDVNKKKLYYVDHHNGHISRVNYDGSMRTILPFNLTRPAGLNFFENHLYSLTTNGAMAKCKLYESMTCDTFKLHSYSTELFIVAQKTRQPKPVNNICLNHTCSYLCIPTKSFYKCLCKNGQVTSPNDTCPDKENGTLIGVKTPYTLTQSVHESSNNKSNVGSIITAVLVPLFVLSFCVCSYYIIKKRNKESLNISMRFYNKTYGLQVDDNEKSILKPGEHEYTNPIGSLQI